MRNFFRKLAGLKVAHHQEHLELIHNATAPLRRVHRSHVMLVLGGLAMAAEIFRRRWHSKTQVPQELPQP
jgi:hypothetical protein